MTAQPSPAPWVVEPGDRRGVWVRAADGHYAALACGTSDEIADANGRLVSSAPDLLDACHELLEACVKAGWDSSGEAGWELVVNNARDAIAKATGP